MPAGVHHILRWLASTSCAATTSDVAEVVVTNPGGGRLHVVARRTPAATTPPGSRPQRRAVGATTPALRADLLLDGEHLAVLTVWRHPGGRHYSVDERNVIEALVGEASDAIAGDPLTSQIRRVACVAEARRVARDIHDTALQQVVGTGLALSASLHDLRGHPAAPGVVRAIEGLEAAAQTLRSVVGNLTANSATNGDTPRGAPRGGPGGRSLHQRVLAAVRVAAGGFAGELTVRVEGPPGPGVPVATADHIVAAAGEGVANAARHAAASRIAVVVRSVPGYFTVRVSDNGCGWRHHPGTVAPQGSGRGLGNLAARAAEAGGGLQVTSTPGRGSEVLWWARHRRVDVNGNGSETVSAGPASPPWG